MSACFLSLKLTSWMFHSAFDSQDLEGALSTSRLYGTTVKNNLNQSSLGISLFLSPSTFLCKFWDKVLILTLLCSLFCGIPGSL